MTIKEGDKVMFSGYDGGFHEATVGKTRNRITSVHYQVWMRDHKNRLELTPVEARLDSKAKRERLRTISA